MTLKVTSVTLDPEIVQIASYKLSKCGSNVSEFCRFCLESFVFDGIELVNPAKIAAEQVASELIKSMKEQKKLLTDEETAKAEAEEYLIKRSAKVETAAKLVFMRYPSFHKFLPENDTFGDFTDALEKVLDEIRQKSGHDVDVTEIRGIWSKMNPEGVMS